MSVEPTLFWGRGQRTSPRSDLFASALLSQAGGLGSHLGHLMDAYCYSQILACWLSRNVSRVRLL